MTNARLSEESDEVFNNKCTNRKQLSPSQKVLLYDLRLHLCSRKLKPKWPSPFIVINVLLHGVIKIKDPTKDKTFKVNE